MDFKNKLGLGRVLVDFYTPTCGPCKLMLPIVEKIAATHRVLKIDASADENQEICDFYSITAVPTFIVFEDGEQIKKFIGVTPETTLVEALNG